MRSVDDDRDGVRQLVEKYELRDWQAEALTAWVGKSRRGAIEAVTGAGKTRLGVAAIDMALNQGYNALVIVPTIELMNQWTTELSRWFGSATIARLGGDYKEWFDKRHRIVTGVVQSAAKCNDEENRLYGDRAPNRLLVADEVHRYAAESWSKALTPNYKMRLGLTATYERTDYRHEEVLDEYFGGVIYRLWYDRALEDKIIADFDIAMVSVDLTIGERGRYDKAQDEYAEARAGLSQYVNFDGPRHKVDRRIQQLASLDDDSRENRLAKKYLRTSRERQRLAASASGKLEVLRAISDAYASSKRTLIFTMTQEAAREAAIAAATEKSPARAVYSDLDKDERAHALRAFKDGSVSSLAAPRILDEGVDVPEADLGIILAMNRSQRQFVQRLGRIIRLKKDGRRAQLVVVYAQRTVEDPYFGTNGDKHLRRVFPFAWRFGRFTFDNQRKELIEFLDLGRLRNKWRDNPHAMQSAKRGAASVRTGRSSAKSSVNRVALERTSLEKASTTPTQRVKETSTTPQLHPTKEMPKSRAAEVLARAISEGTIVNGALVRCIAAGGDIDKPLLTGNLRSDGRVVHNGNQVESLERAARAVTRQRLDWLEAFSMWRLSDGTRLVDVVDQDSLHTALSASTSPDPSTQTAPAVPKLQEETEAPDVTIHLGSILRRALRMEFIDPGDRLEALDVGGAALAAGEVVERGRIRRDDSNELVSLEDFVADAFGEPIPEFARRLRIVGGPTLAALAMVVGEEQHGPGMPRHEGLKKAQPAANRSGEKTPKRQRG